MEAIEREARRLGTSNSDVIRSHVREGIARRGVERAMHGELADHARRLDRLEPIVRALATRFLPPR